MLANNENIPPQYLRDLVEDATGKKSRQWSVPDCGLSSALRFSVLLEGNMRVFVKAATDEQTEQWLRTEHFVLSDTRADFMPQVIKWLDGAGGRPVLITQDLSHACWPASHKGVTWREGDFALLFEGIRELSALKAHPNLPVLQNKRTSIWSKIADAPERFLNLKLCSERWLGNAIDTLIKAEKSADITGNSLVHGDIRSDNVCFAGAQVIFVDWSHAAAGNSVRDLALVLPTLYLEGGPAPYQVMPEGGSEAALGCGEHIRRIADQSMPLWLKNVFRKLIAIELEWAADCLQLEQPDGVRWQSL